MDVYSSVFCVYDICMWLGWCKSSVESDQRKTNLLREIYCYLKHYFEDTSFQFLQLNSEMDVVEHESAGVLYQITQIKDAKVLSFLLKI